jgi:DNA-binding IscR family transcriptional regulator
VLAKDNEVSYALTCKILQKLAKAGIVESTMGPIGGFRLSKEPDDIEFKQIVEAVLAVCSGQFGREAKSIICVPTN